jgi:hypothetical protein
MSSPDVPVNTGIPGSVAVANCWEEFKLDIRVFIKMIKKPPVIIIKDYHVGTGHGIAETVKYQLAKRYTWKTMNKDINNFGKSCEICQMNTRKKKQFLVIRMKSGKLMKSRELIKLNHSKTLGIS